MTVLNKEELKNKISNTFKMLNEVLDSIKHLDDVENESEIREQLKGVAKTVSDLESKRITVPNELRNLKASLVNKLSESEEINKIVRDFYIELKNIVGFNPEPKTPTISKNTTQRKRNTTLTSIQLKDLIDDGILKPNIKIVHRGRYATYYATVTTGGQVLVNINGSNKFFDSPSGAAENITGGNINGWDWWSVISDGRETRLAKYREKYFNKYK